MPLVSTAHWVPLDGATSQHGSLGAPGRCHYRERNLLGPDEYDAVEEDVEEVCAGERLEEEERDGAGSARHVQHHQAHGVAHVAQHAHAAQDHPDVDKLEPGARRRLVPVAVGEVWRVEGLRLRRYHGYRRRRGFLGEKNRRFHLWIFAAACGRCCWIFLCGKKCQSVSEKKVSDD